MRRAAVISALALCVSAMGFALGGSVLGAEPAPASAPKSASPSNDSTLAALRAELERSSRQLRLGTLPSPYYVSYWVVDYEEQTLDATFGALVSSQLDRGRRVRAEVRVGDPTFDNSNFIGEGGFFGDFFRQAALQAPRQIGLDDPAVLRHALWLLTDAAYKDAVETLEKKRAARRSEMDDSAQAASFSATPRLQVVSAEPAAESRGDLAALVKQVSAVFREYPDVQTSDTRLVVSREKRYFANNEGSAITVSTPYTALFISCQTQADDGMPLERSATLETLTGGPPPAERAVAEAHRIARELTALKKAPVVEDYTGPILFEGRAAAQAVHELLSESLSGTPPPKGGESLESPLARKIGKRILPKQLSVIDDPTLTEHGGVPLIGHYVVDDEGVAPERTVLVEAGRLRTLLMSRAPREDITRSNGHGRSGLVGWARGRAGNLIVSAQGGLSKQALRARLLRAVREEGGRYGLVVTELEARAAASSGQAMPQPELMYRLTLDGKEELVRGATISPISVRDLKDIVAAGRESHVYGVAGPSPGGFAVLSSFVSPSLLFEEVEVKKPTRPFKRPPLLPHPHFAARAQ